MTWKTLSHRRKILELRRFSLDGAAMPVAARALGTSHDAVRSFLYKSGLDWSKVRRADGSEARRDGRRTRARGPQVAARDSQRRALVAATRRGLSFDEACAEARVSPRVGRRLVCPERGTVSAFQARALALVPDSEDTEARRKLIVSARLAELRLRSVHGDGARFERKPQRLLVRRQIPASALQPVPAHSACSCALTF